MREPGTYHCFGERESEGERGRASESATENMPCMINSNNPRHPNPKPVRELQVSSDEMITSWSGGQRCLFSN